MALFKKKDAAAGLADESAQDNVSKAPGKKKKASGMSQILHESVLETALDKFRANEAFVRYEKGEKRYVGMILDTADIGGLDKKSRKDEAKGSIIECINSGRIQTYITPDLMDAGYLCIIPDVMTLAAMDEFSLLVDAPYELCQIDDTGDVELLGKKTSYEEISGLVADDGHIDDILGSDTADEEEESDDVDDFLMSMDGSAPEVDSAKAAAFAAPAANQPAGVPVEEIPEDVEETGVESYDPSDPVLAEPEGEGEADVFDPYAAAMQSDAMPEQTIPEEFTNQVVVRKFYSEDLNLAVTSEPFDAQFMQNNPYVPFRVDREPGWINDQLNEMSRAANVRLEHMHKENQWKMRELYFRLVALQCERIRTDLDVHDADTQYGQMYMEICRDRRDSLDMIDSRVSKRKQELEASWRQRLTDVGMEAARAAQHQYRERYGRQHEMEVYNIEAAERAAIDDEYQDALHEMFERRRIEAENLLDLNITEILNEISERYMTALREERELYDQLDSEMRAFVEEHRQDDIARSNALAEELRQSQQADKVLAEQTAKIQSLSEEYRQKREGLLEELENQKRENAQKLAMLKEDNDRERARMTSEREALERKYDELLQRYQDLDATKEKEFESRFAEMRGQNDSLEERNDHLMEVHRRSNLISTFFMIAIAIAMLAIGFIAGEYINTRNRTALEQQKIISEMQDDEETSSADSDFEVVEESNNG